MSTPDNDLTPPVTAPTSSRRRRIGGPAIIGATPSGDSAGGAASGRRRGQDAQGQDAMALDALDVEIIRHLSVDGRTPNREIARALEVPEATVRYRVRRLTDLGIMRITATVDPEALGYALTTVISVSVEPRKFSAAADTIADMREVVWLAVTTGASDIIFTATFRNQDDLFDFVANRLAHVDGIDRIETSVCMHVVKKGQRWSSDLTAASVSVISEDQYDPNVVMPLDDPDADMPGEQGSQTASTEASETIDDDQA